MVDAGVAETPTNTRSPASGWGVQPVFAHTSLEEKKLASLNDGWRLNCMYCNS
jgi:hypothetical protein